MLNAITDEPKTNAVAQCNDYDDGDFLSIHSFLERRGLAPQPEWFVV